MREDEQRQRVRAAIDHRLSSLEGDPWLARRIVAKSKGEKPVMKKKTSLGLALAMALLLIAATALAVGLMFSPRYEASKLANAALLNQYGIDEKLMTLFYRETTQGEDGSATVTYTPVEASARLGVYTVTVKDGKARALWSHDGADTSGGLQAAAWGKEQVEMLVTDYTTVMRYLMDSGAAPTPGPDAPAATPPRSEEEYQTAVAQNKEKVLSAAKIALDEAQEKALLALVGEYGLTGEQEALLQIYEGEETYRLEEGRPTVSFYYYLTQGDAWMEKDGIYVVKVNLVTGEIEDILYDSALAGNG